MSREVKIKYYGKEAANGKLNLQETKEYMEFLNQEKTRTIICNLIRYGGTAICIILGISIRLFSNKITEKIMLK